MATIWGPNIVRDGLVLYLDAANTRSYSGSGTTWSDLSGNGNDATVGSSVTYSSTNGGGLTTLNEASNSNTAINGTFSLSSALYTWEIWFTDASGGNANNDSTGFCVKNSGGITSNGFRYRQTISQVWTDGTLGQLGGGINEYNVQFQIVLQRDGSYLRVYRNGVQSASITVPGTQDFGTFIDYSMNDISQSSSGFGWNGTYYIVRMYNRDLTSAEVLQNFEAHKGRYGL